MESVTILQFSLGSENYGVDVGQVLGIERYVHISRMPKMPKFVRGIINIRGHVLTIIDLKKQLGLYSSKPNANTRIIVADVNGDKIGFIVDYVEDIHEIPLTEIESPGEFALKMGKYFITGVWLNRGKSVTLLDFTKLLEKTELQMLRELSDDETNYQ